MKENSFAHVCAYLSLAISITMLVLWCCNVGGFTVVSLDSFVGIIVALLAIVVTISIGWQVYNTIEIKNRIEKVDELEEIYNKQENMIQQIQNHSLYLIYASMGNSALNDYQLASKINSSSTTYQLLAAFIYYMKSLNSSVSLESPLNTQTLLDFLKYITTQQIQEGTTDKYMDDIKDINNKIRSSKHYDIIKNHYENIYNDFISKVKGEQ